MVDLGVRVRVLAVRDWLEKRCLSGRNRHDDWGVRIGSEKVSVRVDDRVRVGLDGLKLAIKDKLP